jgi:Putative outer membrane beta-barrel porin, MtrB/PioB
VEGSIERETFQRDFRERDETWEDKFKLSYVNRGAIEGTIRVSYEHDRRGGGDYDPNPYVAFLSASLGPTPVANNVAMSSWFHSINQFRSFDLADRNQNVLNGRIDYALRQDLDGAVTLQVKDAEFPAELGRTGHQRSNSATVDLSYQAGSNAVLYGYYSYQSGTMEQRGVHPNSCIMGSTYYFYSDGRVLNAATCAAPPATPAGTTLIATQNVLAANYGDVCGNAAATSPLFPDSRGWEVSSKDRNDALGFGGKYDFGRVKLDANFTRSLGRTRIGYSYNPAALGLSAVQTGLAGNGLSDMTFAQNVFNASLLTPVTKDVLLRFLVRHETGKIRDWHYDGLATNPMPTNNAAYLDAGPQDYRTTLVGIMFHMRM